MRLFLAASAAAAAYWFGLFFCVLPVFGQGGPPCLMGESFASLFSHYVETTGKRPLFSFEIPADSGQNLAAFVLLGEDNSVAVIYRSADGMMCFIAFGENATPGSSVKLPAIKPPDKPESDI